MATKHTDECLKKAADDEPIFVLRAQDVTAPKTVEFWAAAAYNAGTPKAKLTEALDLAEKMRQWQKTHGAKVPD